MKRKHIWQALNLARNSTKKVKITFKREIAESAVHLYELDDDGFIFLENVEIVILVAVMKRNSWGLDSEHVFPITLTNNFNMETFLNLMTDAIETIEAV